MDNTKKTEYRKKSRFKNHGQHGVSGWPLVVAAAMVTETYGKNPNATACFS